MEENKFIVMDFWATWCGPCTIMDREMWSSDIINEVSANFIPLKIDVDRNSGLAIEFMASSIPKVVIIDPAGNIVWEEVGYSSPAPYIKVFKQIPNSILPTAALKKENQKTGDIGSWYELGLSYQKMAQDISSVSLQRGFFKQSDGYFKIIEKKATSDEIALDARLNRILNTAYKGKTKQALKQLAKEEIDDVDLVYYIQAYCYKCTGDQEEMRRYMDKISDPDLLAELQ